MSMENDARPPLPQHLLMAAIIFAVIAALVIWPQWGFVANWYAFVAIVLVLLGLSFLSSAIEAAIPLAKDDPETRDRIAKEKREIAQEEERLSQEKKDAKSRGLTRDLKAIVRKTRKQDNRLLYSQEKWLVLSGNGIRELYIGSLAAFSVFSNAALVAFLPLALVDIAEPGFIEIRVPTLSSAANALEAQGGSKIESWSMDLSSRPVFVFLVVSFPILIFGKILPKTLAQRRPYIFACGCFRFAWLCENVFSVVVQAIRWVLNVFHRGK